MKKTNWRVQVLLQSIGTPYVWGAGNLRDAKWIADGYDCSGFAQAALRAIWLLDGSEWVDETASGLAYKCDPIDQANARVGDLAFYGGSKITHVTVCLDDHMCIGANGGGSKTFGDDEKACVQVRPIRYRTDLKVIGRLKSGLSKA